MPRSPSSLCALALGMALVFCPAEAQRAGAYFHGRFPDRPPGVIDQWQLAPAFLPRFDNVMDIDVVPASDRLCVATRDGRVFTFDKHAGSAQKTLLADLSSNVAVVTDGGFMGVAFHPHFGQPGAAHAEHVYFYYCANDTGSYPSFPTFGFFDCYLRLSRFDVPAGTWAIDPQSEVRMLDLRLHNTTHRGGNITFWSDGFLYVPVGDQVRELHAQSIDDNLEGGILRLLHVQPRRRRLDQRHGARDRNPGFDPAGQRAAAGCRPALRSPGVRLVGGPRPLIVAAARSPAQSDGANRESGERRPAACGTLGGMAGDRSDTPDPSTSDGRLDERGVLISDRYGDVYFADDRNGDSVATGLAQARCVFVEGNDLPNRWGASGAGPFTIGETGFGSGLTFLAAWQAFRRFAPAAATLHYWSAERHPLAPDVQRQIAFRADPVLGADLATRYRNALSLQDRGTLRISLDEGRVQLTLALGDAATMLRTHTFWADAWFLDGFAPARNPAMWSAELLQLISARSRPGATAATWCAAGHVRRALEAAGFAVERRPGFGGKRHRITAALRRPAQASSSLAPWQLRPQPWTGPRRARVVGTGIAGATVARALAERGFEVSVASASSPVARPPLPIAVVQPRFAPADAFGPAWATAGFRFAAPFYDDLADRTDRGVRPCGVFHPARDERDRIDQLQRLAAAAPPADLGRWIDSDATVSVGIPAGIGPHGGTWIPRGLVVAPAAVCAALLVHPAIHRQPAPDGDDAALTVLAHGLGAAGHPACGWLDLRPVRGQLTAVDDGVPAVTCVLAGGGHMTPAQAGWRWLGATYSRGDTSLKAREEDDHANMARLATLAPFDAARPTARASWVGVRMSTADSVPMVGPLPDPTAFEAEHGAQLRGARVPAGRHGPMPRTLASLGHGSRGFTTTPLTSRVLADLVDGTPLPVDDALAWRLWPARCLARTIARR